MSETISTLIGILLDVSGSMKENVGGGVHEEKGAWVRSIFQVIDMLIERDVSSSNHVFAVGFGASHGNGIFDLIGTLEQFQNKDPYGLHSVRRSYDEIIERILTIVENSGAGTVRKWAQKDVIRNAVSRDMASLILSKLEFDRNFKSSFVNHCLPPACRDFGNPNTPTTGTEFLNSLYSGYASLVSTFKAATEEDIIEVVEKTKHMLLKDVSAKTSIFRVGRTSDIVHGCVTEEELSETRIQELMKTVEPFIYGKTPLCRSLEKAAELFLDGRYRDHKKLLFVLSDGMPSDDENEYQFRSKLKNADVTVVSCFITKSKHDDEANTLWRPLFPFLSFQFGLWSNYLETELRSKQVEPHRLYCTADQKWREDAKFMFELSSTIPTQLLPRTVLIKRRWKIDIKNNETRLFLQVNHPDIIRDACDLARNVVCSQDALSDFLVSVSLDIYINQSTTEFPAQKQKKGTCYAHASATVLHLSMRRILGREGGYPDFRKLRKQLIDANCGEVGANTLKVLQKFCPRYRLRCQEVDISGAMKAITAKRPVVARFRLSTSEWEVFKAFYRNNPTGILTENDIDVRKRPKVVETHGHAVVLTSYNSKCLFLMNSKGVKWGDMGFFRVKTADAIGFKFVDVFWTLEDLTDNEKAYHDRHGTEVAKWLMDNFIGLQLSQYQCPLCSEKSLVTEFKGQLLRATCPKCRGEFRSDEAGNILALNMYLTSLSR